MKMKYAILFLLIISIFTKDVEYKCGLKKEAFQAVIDGKKTDLYILTNKNGYEVALTNFGGHLAAIMAPDKDGKFQNIVQGHDSIDSLRNSPEKFLSTLVGRYGNRINKGKFTLKGKEYNLAINAETNHMHGGPTGFHVRVWDAEQINEHEVTLTYVSPDGEEGYPGTLTMKVTFSLNDNNELKLSYRGTTDKTTIVNMTHHVFFNLHGLVDPCPSIEDHILTLNSNFYLPTDETKIPTGAIQSVKNTPFDFTKPTKVGKNINDFTNIDIKIGNGYDHCFLTNQKHPGELTFAAKVEDPTSKRYLEMYTTEPGFQIYTANWHSGFRAYHGVRLPKRSGIALEAQKFPDTPNIGHFPSCVLNPGETYVQDTIYKFGVSQ